MRFRLEESPLRGTQKAVHACMFRRNNTIQLPKPKWTSKKPLAQGRFWWNNQTTGSVALVYVEKQYLGFYILGIAWLPYQSGKWDGPFGESDPGSRN